MPLASIQKIISLSPIKDADRIETAKVLGWDCIVRKGEFKEGDLCIYIEIDSLIPREDWSEFLFKNEKDKYRLRTMKMKGQLSQGLVLPLQIDPISCEDWDINLQTGIAKAGNTGSYIKTFNIGDDVTNNLGITKYEKQIPIALAGQIKGDFPSFIPKTDEVRIQSELKLLEDLKGKPYYITTKLDGTSATYYKLNGEFEVCSRNLRIKNPEQATYHDKSEEGVKSENVYWKMAKKYKIEEWLPDGYAIQGEICGPGIQKNPLKLSDQELFIFNVFNIKEGKYYFPSDDVYIDDATVNVGLKLVPLATDFGSEFNYSLEELLEKAKGKYPNGGNKEGIVVRSMDQLISFKVVNNDYLLKDEE